MNALSTKAPRRSRWFPRIFWLLYAAAVCTSLFSEHQRAHSASSSRPSVTVPAFTASGQQRGTLTIAYDDHSAPSGKLPILLLHGSPGNGSELGDMAKPLQAAGYRVITPDLPGFGDSTRNPPSLSILAHAHEVLALMDQLHIQRVHILGWSLGGGVAMHIADLAPDRVASLTLMASISDQHVEGTGSYFAEHAKYAMGYVAATFARYSIPHFGYLSHFDEIRASMRNFWDSDMRPLTDLMRHLKTPTLILHGRNDFLVPFWAAEHSHELIEPSTLIMTPYSHFFPFMQPDYAAAQLLPFFERHNTPSPALRQTIILNPEPAPLLGAPGRWVKLQLRHSHWLTLLTACTALLLYRFRTAAILIFIAVSFSLFDNGIAFGAILLTQLLTAAVCILRGRAKSRGTGVSPVPTTLGSGLSTRTPSHWRTLLTSHPILTAFASRFIPDESESAFTALGWPAAPRRAHLLFLLTSILAACLWTLFYFITTLLASIFIIRPLIAHLGATGLFLGIIAAIVAVQALELLLTTTGRRLLRIRFTRITRREYWPAELLYYPMAPNYIYLGLRYGPIAFTACNPGIDNGGGVIGESKQAILDALPSGSGLILKSTLIPANPDPAVRTDLARRAIASDPALSFPVILKPDSGYRGHAVKLARSDADLAAYFRSMLAPAIIQQYHPGPHECGILWARNPASPSGPGSIFSITRKDFPVLIGDGRRTLEQLIFAHPRFHAQAATFLSRFADQRQRILDKGETLRLAQSGNHCQGTLFRDGADLITPALSAVIDALAQGFRGGLDIGRFDIRYHSDESLRRGLGFSILELNGVTGESTNIYDPNRSIFWAFKVTLQQWKLMYQLGAARIASGHKPLPLRQLCRDIHNHKSSRSGSALAD